MLGFAVAKARSLLLRCNPPSFKTRSQPTIIAVAPVTTVAVTGGSRIGVADKSIPPSAGFAFASLAW
jgi:hypothetical protein